MERPDHSPLSHSQVQWFLLWRSFQFLNRTHIDLAPFFEPLKMRELRRFVDQHVLVPVFDNSDYYVVDLHCNGTAILQ